MPIFAPVSLFGDSAAAMVDGRSAFSPKLLTTRRSSRSHVFKRGEDTLESNSIAVGGVVDTSPASESAAERNRLVSIACFQCLDAFS
jgi:hypothetical protein